MLTQYERSEARFEHRETKVSRLLKELEGEIVNMVPWRHYGALLNCLRETHRTLLNAKDIVAKNDAELYKQVIMVLEIVDAYLYEPRITNVKDINEHNKTFEMPPLSPLPVKPKKSRAKIVKRRKK